VVSLGVKPDLVSAQGFGDSNPVASNDTAQGRAQNRRVELSLAGSSC
jgi:chemotaxis protein MotB